MSVSKAAMFHPLPRTTAISIFVQIVPYSAVLVILSAPGKQQTIIMFIVACTYMVK